MTKKEIKLKLKQNRDKLALLLQERYGDGANWPGFKQEIVGTEWKYVAEDLMKDIEKQSKKEAKKSQKAYKKELKKETKRLMDEATLSGKVNAYTQGQILAECQEKARNNIAFIQPKNLFDLLKEDNGANIVFEELVQNGELDKASGKGYIWWKGVVSEEQNKDDIVEEDLDIGITVEDVLQIDENEEQFAENKPEEAEVKEEDLVIEETVELEETPEEPTEDDEVANAKSETKVLVKIEEPESEAEKLEDSESEAEEKQEEAEEVIEEETLASEEETNEEDEGFIKLR